MYCSEELDSCLPRLGKGKIIWFLNKALTFISWLFTIRFIFKRTAVLLFPGHFQWFDIRANWYSIPFIIITKNAVKKMIHAYMRWKWLWTTIFYHYNLSNIIAANKGFRQTLFWNVPGYTAGKVRLFPLKHTSCFPFEDRDDRGTYANLFDGLSNQFESYSLPYLCFGIHSPQDKYYFCFAFSDLAATLRWVIKMYHRNVSSTNRWRRE